jgi:hypothetical protein
MIASSIAAKTMPGTSIACRRKISGSNFPIPPESRLKGNAFKRQIEHDDQAREKQPQPQRSGDRRTYFL